MVASCCFYVTWRFVPPHTSVAMLVPCVWAHAPVWAGFVVRGGDFSWRGLVVRGGDLSCKTETSRGSSSSGKQFGDAANWPKTGRLASVGLDQDLLSSLSGIFALTLTILTFTLSMVLECLVFLGG
jgi:hypothetical protein